MKTFVRLASLMLCLLMTVTLFCACGKDTDETASTESAVGDLSTADITFSDGNGASVYRIVRADSMENGSSLSGSIFRALKEKYGVSAESLADVDNSDAAAEILIGNTNRESSAKALELLKTNATKRHDEYIICSMDDDIIIVGITDEATNAGVQYFIDNYLTGGTITGGLNYINNTSANYTDVALFGNANLYGIEVVRPIYNVSYITQIEIENLIDTVRSKTGYELYIKNDQTASDTDHSTDGSGTLTPNTPAAYEIIIGNCVRDGVKTFTDYNEYEIRIESNKIFLNGGSPYATTMAVSEFIKLINNNTAVTADMSVSSGDYEASVASYDKATYYTPSWQENFDGTAVDTGLWSLNLDASSGYANGDKKTYRGSSKLKNNYIKDGKLYIEGVTDENGYYGGLLDTMEKFCYKYGYIELSCIKPKGNGFWTSLWTNSYGSGTQGPEDVKEILYFSETDVEECYGEGGNWIYGNTYAWPTVYGKNSGLLNIPDGKIGLIERNNKFDCLDDRGFWMDFHTFGFEWNEDYHVRFTVDGVSWVDWTLEEGPEQHAYSYPVYLKLSMACGTSGKYPTDTYEQQNTNKYITDYVHIYQKAGQKTYYKSGTSAWVTKTVV